MTIMTRMKDVYAVNARNEISLPAKSFDIQKYRTAATALLRPGRFHELRDHNRHVPACNLPPRVLEKIFLDCCLSSLEYPDWSWITISLICSSWRRAALQNQALWTHVDYSHPRWTALSLHRAQALPLSIRALVSDSNQRLILQTLEWAPKVRDIHLVASLQHIAPLIGFLKLSNPYLLSLVVQITKPDADNDIRFSKRSDVTMVASLPALKNLELHRCPLSMVSPRFTGLTRLSLHYLPFSERPSRHEFLSLLEKFPSLRHLELDHAFPKNTIPSNKSSRSIMFSNLISLSLTGSIQELNNVLECVALQPAARLRCRVDKMSDYKANFWKLARVIGSHFHEVAWAMPLDTLVITGYEASHRFLTNYDINAEFQQSLRFRAFGIDPKSTDPVLDFMIGPDPHTGRDEVLVTAFKAVWEALPLSQLHTLALQSFDIVTQRTWPRLLKSLQSLRVLDVCGHVPSGLLWALLLNARSYSHLEHDDLDGLLLPRLEDVYVHNVDCFSGGYMMSLSDTNSYTDLDDSRFLNVLLAYLEDRHRCGLALRSLCLARCIHVCSDALEELRTCVAYLWWDNRGLHKGDELYAESPAVYRQSWISEPPPRRHFFRLQLLSGSD